jgi:DNA-binding NarL/FixJ family response regulator
MMPDKLKIMLVDDHYLVRMGLRSILALEPDMTVCAEASTGEQAQVLFRSHRPDVTLMDLRLPGMNGSETMHEIRGEFPDARMVMISTYVGDEEIYGALQAGAMAYLVKSVQREELTAAIRKAAVGQRHIPPEVAARLACSSGAAATGRSPSRSRSPKARSSCMSAASWENSALSTVRRRSQRPCRGESSNWINELNLEPEPEP